MMHWYCKTLFLLYNLSMASSRRPTTKVKNMADFIKFTKPQIAAISHRLSLGDVFPEVFKQSRGFGHLVKGSCKRADEMNDELLKTGKITSNAKSEMDAEILAECIDGSTWPAAHAGIDVPKSEYNAAYRATKGAAKAIQDFYGLGKLTVPAY
jgi:hypothetical protein